MLGIVLNAGDIPMNKTNSCHIELTFLSEKTDKVSKMFSKFDGDMCYGEK